MDIYRLLMEVYFCFGENGLVNSDVNDVGILGEFSNVFNLTSFKDKNQIQV